MNVKKLPKKFADFVGNEHKTIINSFGWFYWKFFYYIGAKYNTQLGS